MVNIFSTGSLLAAGVGLKGNDMNKYVEYSRGDLITIIKQQQAEIDGLVEMLEEMLYSNSTKYREEAEALIAKHKGE